MAHSVSDTAIEGVSLAQLARWRSQVYRSLSMVFDRPMDEQVLAGLGHWLRQVELLQPTMPSPLERGLAGAAQWIITHASNPATLAALGTEFTHLFRGISRTSSPLPPYESAYAEGLLYGAATAQVSQLYRRFNIAVDGSEPPDHISAELDFMRFVCAAEASAWPQHDGRGEERDQARRLLQDEAAFLSEHLLQWVPAFCANVRQHDGSSLYVHLSDLVQGWISLDSETVNELLGLTAPG